jgi:hypothetical protein
MRILCILISLAICATFLWSNLDLWPHAVKAFHDLNGAMIGLMVLSLLAASIFALVQHFGGVSGEGASERGSARADDSDDDSD